MSAIIIINTLRLHTHGKTTCAELLAKYTAPNDEDVQLDILNKVTDYCGKKVTNHTLDEYVDPYQWTFYHSVFFAFTVCSTLGNKKLRHI